MSESKQRQSSEPLVEIHTNEQLGKLLSHHKIVFVLFYLPGCPPCEAFKPVYKQVADKLSRERKDTVFTQVSVGARWENPMVKMYNVDGTPTLLRLTAHPEIQIDNVDIEFSESKFRQIALKALKV